MRIYRTRNCSDVFGPHRGDGVGNVGRRELLKPAIENRNGLQYAEDDAYDGHELSSLSGKGAGANHRPDFQN